MPENRAEDHCRDDECLDQSVGTSTLEIVHSEKETKHPEEPLNADWITKESKAEHDVSYAFSGSPEETKRAALRAAVSRKNFFGGVPEGEP